MTITHDIKDGIYIKLIQYALETSDAFLLVSLNSPVSSISAAKQIELVREALPSYKFNGEIIENLQNKKMKMLLMPKNSRIVVCLFSKN